MLRATLLSILLVLTIVQFSQTKFLQKELKSETKRRLNSDDVSVLKDTVEEMQNVWQFIVTTAEESEYPLDKSVVHLTQNYNDKNFWNLEAQNGFLTYSEMEAGLKEEDLRERDETTEKRDIVKGNNDFLPEEAWQSIIKSDLNNMDPNTWILVLYGEFDESKKDFQAPIKLLALRNDKLKQQIDWIKIEGTYSVPANIRDKYYKFTAFSATMPFVRNIIGDFVSFTWSQETDLKQLEGDYFASIMSVHLLNFWKNDLDLSTIKTAVDI